ncbi:hypothetical protein BDN71DRAFT_525184 [Pleurotus eryngii]|uniref:Uncharacterized protein n=1 Tax=Pleurotus eryngii TaxID=5323 RepID=A0A9P5ZJD9_PLEER|nr:hypothetical protein BDN71DRAFT_525184 [Pleurotus eryngii]
MMMMIDEEGCETVADFRMSAVESMQCGRTQLVLHAHSLCHIARRKIFITKIRIHAKCTIHRVERASNLSHHLGGVIWGQSRHGGPRRRAMPRVHVISAPQTKNESCVRREETRNQTVGQGDFGG